MILAFAFKRSFLIDVVMTHHEHGPARKMASGAVILDDTVYDEAFFVAKDPVSTALTLDGQILTDGSNAPE
jgi:hypothetical protein